MPIPKPKDKENEKKFISRCIKTLTKRDPNRPRDQIIAICYSQYGESKKKQRRKYGRKNGIF